MGTLVDALSATLPDGALRFDAPVVSIAPGAGGWDVRTASGECLHARALVLAAPAHVVARLLAPLDAHAADLCAAVPYVSTASVTLAWPRPAVPHALSGTGFVVARRHSDVRITAATWVSAKWDGRAPDDTALFRVFLGGAHDPAVVDLTDDEAIAVACRDLQAVLGIAVGPSLARVFRWRRAGAQHTVGHLQRVNEIEQRLRALGTLYVAGAGFRSVGIPDCVADARRIAAVIAETTAHG
jgi:oxygen-dependent protoporphyrinogen oxidase